ncbi:MAG: Asp-tRNA(Asn)/Glu-tRNA(Gln) amidotransferase subunit GatB [Candidatus Omnitrophica bacterium]|nr:Asp-tRNA(Asn)/Glu-tRNA(Gln) amidotransferase subunit GatB [Candidatus Omnitrophota bacterium]
MTYEAVIGLEVHVHLRTKSKAFCGCSTEFGSPPNTQTCPVCLGFPGSLPVLNKQALDFAILTGLALNCRVNEFTKFDRKNYFYPDLPKNYQISQFDLPVCLDGFLDIEVDGKIKRINIKRVHLEEDAGKLIHKENKSLVDFNRCGIPLLEIVSQPDMNSAQEAYEYLTLLKSTLEYLNISDCDMEKGSLRCDANISIREKGQAGLGTKTELKNMNSFKGVKDALEYEIKRQSEAVENGEKIIQDTRLWDVDKGKTFSMRSKEEAKDYRYFPEPDLPPFIISKEKEAEIKKTIPELPREKLARFMRDYSLSAYDAKILVDTREVADFAEECLKSFNKPDKKIMANWLIGPLSSIAAENKCSIAEVKIPGGIAGLNDLISRVIDGSISNLAGKTVLGEMVATGKNAEVVIKEKNLAQISDTASLEDIAGQVIGENAKSAADYKSGKAGAIMFLVGQVMKKSGGKANPKVVQEILKRRLDNA